MKTKFFKAFSIVMVVAMLLPMAALAQSPTPPTKPERVEKTPLTDELPAEIIEQFKDGMPVSEFLARINGPIPKALEPFADLNVTVIVEMEGQPLAALYAQNSSMSTAAQAQYSQTLLQAQAAVEAKLSKNATVISNYTKAYNGMLVNLPAKELQALRSLPGVKAVRPAPVHYANLSTSVPLINADMVWADPGVDGTGITIAVIDTGIDYTHAALGGSGDPDDYANNDPNIVEPGTFPTAKVIGGYDFAGTDYDASDPANSIPVPDDDPLDENGHGTHVASTAAGIGVPGKIGMGVAPGATLYALKVFGASGSTNLTVDAIEWAMDPNGDGDLSDHVDVINMSLGSTWGPNDVNDPDIVATNFASQIGIVVVASAGNSGDSHYIVGSPSVADSAISVAASTTGFQTGPTVSVPGTGDEYIYTPGGFDNNTGHFTETITATLGYIGAYTTTNTLCSTAGITPSILTGKIALISRGDCTFSSKINNAAELGAVAALIYNNVPGSLGMIGTPVDIPAGSLSQADGQLLVPQHDNTVVVSAEDEVTTLPSDVPADTIATFSSRGPRGYDSYLKPEVSAPGVAIFAAAMGSGSDGVSYSGTSMAAPHTAGVAALIKAAHPYYTPEMVKAAMMNTAVDLVSGDVVPQQGAGRIDAYAAVTTTSLIVGNDDLVSVNWGLIEIDPASAGYYDTQNITLYNLDAVTKTYVTAAIFATGSYTMGVALDMPMVIEVPPMSSSNDYVDLYVDPALFGTYYGGDLEEVYGYLVFTDTLTSDVLRVPFYALPRPYTALDVADQGLVAPFDGVALITQTGSISSSLWAYPTFIVDGWDRDQSDQGDLRYVGMSVMSGGSFVVPAFNTYGPWHTPQPYFAEFDLYIDSDGDGAADFVDFNFNYGWATGGDQNNDWLVFQVDLASGMLYLASPYMIYTDFNSGFMEWYLPTTWNSLDPANTDFDFELAVFDDQGNMDYGGTWYFDTARPPMYTTLLRSMFLGEDVGPNNPYDTLFYGVDDASGYFASRPLGAMVVDYHGQPGMGEVYYFPTEFDFFDIFLPLIFK